MKGNSISIQTNGCNNNGMTIAKILNKNSEIFDYNKDGVESDTTRAFNIGFIPSISGNRANSISMEGVGAYSFNEVPTFGSRSHSEQNSNFPSIDF